MKKIFILFTFLILIVPSVQSKEIDSLLEQADLLYASREVIELCEKSIELYKKVLEADPNNYEACWKIMRACKWLGDKYPKEKRLKIIETGEPFVKKAIEINPEGIEGHFWYGVCMGRIGEERGILNSLFLVGPIKDEMEKVLKLDPEHDGAHYVLSALYRKAPGWPLSCGDINKSKEHALLAIKYNPQGILNHIGLAEVYIDMGKYREAKRELLIALDLPFEEDRIPEGKDDKAKAKKLLSEVKKKLGD